MIRHSSQATRSIGIGAPPICDTTVTIRRRQSHELGTRLNSVESGGSSRPSNLRYWRFRAARSDVIAIGRDRIRCRLVRSRSWVFLAESPPRTGSFATGLTFRIWHAVRHEDLFHHSSPGAFLNCILFGLFHPMYDRVYLRLPIHRRSSCFFLILLDRRTQTWQDSYRQANHLRTKVLVLH